MSEKTILTARANDVIGLVAGLLLGLVLALAADDWSLLALGLVLGIGLMGAGPLVRRTKEEKNDER